MAELSHEQELMGEIERSVDLTAADYLDCLGAEVQRVTARALGRSDEGIVPQRSYSDIPVISFKRRTHTSYRALDSLRQEVEKATNAIREHGFRTLAEETTSGVKEVSEQIANLNEQVKKLRTEICSAQAELAAFTDKQARFIQTARRPLAFVKKMFSFGRKQNGR